MNSYPVRIIIISLVVSFSWKIGYKSNLYKAMTCCVFNVLKYTCDIMLPKGVYYYVSTVVVFNFTHGLLKDGCFIFKSDEIPM